MQNEMFACQGVEMDLFTIFAVVLTAPGGNSTRKFLSESVSFEVMLQNQGDKNVHFIVYDTIAQKNFDSHTNFKKGAWCHLTFWIMGKQEDILVFDI